MTDLRFLDPTALTNRAAFNERFEILNELYRYWWRRISQESYYDEEKYAASPVVLCTISRNYTIYYSDTISISDSGEITLVDPTSKVAEFHGNTDSGVSFVRGSYFRIGNTATATTLYYAAEDAALYYDTMKGECGLYVSQVVAKEIQSGDIDYVHSSNRSAYPDSGIQDGYEYEYLGVPFDNAVTAPKIATGSYVGTGTSGSANPNTLTFDFEPSIIFIFQASGNPVSGNYYTGYFAFLVNGASHSISCYGGNGISTYPLYTVFGTTCEWYPAANVSEYTQLNRSGIEYKYLALG